MPEARTPVDQIFVNAPLTRLREELIDFLVRHRINPEIGLETEQLWTLQPRELEPLARRLQEAELACTLHAPFQDLVPGGCESRMVALSRKKLRRAFALIPVFGPRLIVCHLGYDPLRHASSWQQWLDTALDTWRPLLDLAEELGTRVMFENTYEPDPSIHQRFLSRLDHPAAGFCLDTGHLLAFARDGQWRNWLAALSPWLGHLHLHDNNGKTDQHLVPGAGRFDFPALFSGLHQHGLTPPATLEPHRETDILPSLRQLTAFMHLPSSSFT